MGWVLKVGSTRKADAVDASGGHAELAATKACSPGSEQGLCFGKMIVIQRINEVEVLECKAEVIAGTSYFLLREEVYSHKGDVNVQ